MPERGGPSTAAAGKLRRSLFSFLRISMTSVRPSLNRPCLQPRCTPSVGVSTKRVLRLHELTEQTQQNCGATEICHSRVIRVHAPSGTTETGWDFSRLIGSDLLIRVVPGTGSTAAAQTTCDPGKSRGGGTKIRLPSFGIYTRPVKLIRRLKEVRPQRRYWLRTAHLYHAGA